MPPAQRPRPPPKRPATPTTPLRLALLALLLAPAALAHPRPPWTPRLPTDITLWTYHPDWAVYQHLRVWDRPTLHHASRETNFHQMYSLLDKLHSGQPIRVAAFGDSITANHAGCFNDDDEGEGGAPNMDPRHKQQDPCSVGRVVLMPWLEAFMTMVNATWPHPGHRAVNLGLPGSSFGTYAEGECVEQSLSRQVDLVVLEHLPYLEAPNGTVLEAERLLHRLWLHLDLPLPAVVFLNMHLALEGESPEPMQQCIQVQALCAECPTSFNDLPRPQSLTLEAEVHTHLVAKYYGMASLSYVTAIQTMLLNQVPEGLGMNRCRFFSSLYLDRVHPRDSGRLLITDLLVNYLVSAEQHLAALGQDATSRHTRAAPAIPARPMDPASNRVYRMRCYYSAPAGAAEAGGQGAAAAVVGPMRVARAEGWAYVERDGESQKYKPGWVGSAPGAVLWLELDPSLPNLAEHHQGGSRSRAAEAGAEGAAGREGGAGEREDGGAAAAAAAAAARAHSISAAVGDHVYVVLTYLRSYRHMGRAQVSCLEACSCGPFELDGHEPNFPHSIADMKIFQAHVSAPTQRCLLEVKVLPDSSSGEHKFKVAHVTVGNLRDMTEPLRIVAQRVEELKNQI